MVQVWYITGASSWLGLDLVKHLLEKGDKVAATSRNIAKLESLISKESESFLPLSLNFKENIEENIQANLETIKQKFSRLDNVVNNAGYGLLGFVEEVGVQRLKEQFEINVFVPYLIIQNALKIMRPQSISEGGNSQNIKARIYNLSSIGGFRVSNNSTPYCMSKFAISALSEGLMLDVGEYGIHTINVMPSGFRTEFLGGNMKLGDNEIAAYDSRREAFLHNAKAYNGKQAGDPKAFARIIYETSRMPNPPLHLFVGEAAYSNAKEKIAWLEKEMQGTRDYAGIAADFSDSIKSAFSGKA